MLVMLRSPNAFATPIQQYFPPRSPLAATGGLRGGKYDQTPSTHESDISTQTKCNQARRRESCAGITI